MTTLAKTDTTLLRGILLDYQMGLSPASICKKFDLSERNYGSIVKRHAVEFKKLRTMRSSKQKEKNNAARGKHQSVPSSLSVQKSKITPEEKIDHLESLLEREKKKNIELEELLRLVKERLGKL